MHTHTNVYSSLDNTFIRSHTHTACIYSSLVYRERYGCDMTVIMLAIMSKINGVKCSQWLNLDDVGYSQTAIKESQQI